MSKDKLVLAIVRAIPYPNQMYDLDTTSEPNAIRFSWRQDRFRVSTTQGGRRLVEQCEGKHTLVGSNAAILMGAMIDSVIQDMAIAEESATIRQ